MLREQRKRRIAQLVKEDGHVTVLALSEMFGVSPSTIRRDLHALDMEGMVMRTHGGAVVARAAPEPPIVQRMVDRLAEKERIGRAAARLVGNGQTVFIGSGTTTELVARSLLGRNDLTVITNALNIVNVFASSPSITVVVLGGVLRHSEHSMIGHLTEAGLRELHAAKAFIGIRAISLEHGLMNDYPQETQTDRAIIEHSSELILVADHTKLGKVSTAYVAPLTRVHRLVTDTLAPEAFVDRIREMGIEVIIA